MTATDDPRLHHPPQFMSQSRYLQGPRYLPRDPLGETDIETQESHNETTLLSEAVVPALSGFPDVKEFDQLMQNYVKDLSIKKQDKALIYAKRARNIRTVLIDPKDTAVESAQFRFWVKKMFKLQAVGSDGSQGTDLPLRQDLSNLPGAPWWITPDAAQFAKKFPQTGNGLSIPQTAVAANLTTRVLVCWSDAP
ncbi:hypothetical protein PDIG_40700 [Penicillium digitatum PHI26]|uniref:Uncharacterized protein n=2 Tax=Penicillium digitatum TaxID=36651 RepID=K9GIL2_PEND2|nr:hypothetical protein PDIP_26250 [Penicillium digitatum Pd1]EKV13046.1 hypothetical protein PDIG_40700 [Penicillium digitatum PHI26]EKV18739.1 hypothetical protein PDIP_26250 [Penicillium digitatum Pd1]